MMRPVPVLSNRFAKHAEKVTREFEVPASTNPILVDPRVGSKDLAPILSSLKVPNQLTHLDSGDFAFAGNLSDGTAMVGVERKRITASSNDLLQSITEDRLSGFQLVKMREQYTHLYLITEGTFRANDKGGLEIKDDDSGRWVDARGTFGQNGGYARVQSFLHHLQHTGIVVVNTACAADTGRYLRAIYNWWQRPYESHADSDTFYRNIPDSSVHRVVGRVIRFRDLPEHKQIIWSCAAGFPGVATKAADIADKFETLFDMAMANLQAWESVLGKGKRARHIYQLIRGSNPRDLE
jgi:ERCC4-type nuclease